MVTCFYCTLLCEVEFGIIHNYTTSFVLDKRTMYLIDLILKSLIRFVDSIELVQHSGSKCVKNNFSQHPMCFGQIFRLKMVDFSLRLVVVYHSESHKNLNVLTSGHCLALGSFDRSTDDGGLEVVRV